MLTKRIIPCLDIEGGRVVKGVNFVNITDIGDPVEFGKFYEEEGADELVFLDISASWENRGTAIELVARVAHELFIPFTVGGGIRTVKDMRSILYAGSDKIALNTQAIRDPELITRGARYFGNQCIVVAIDAKRVAGRWEVFINGGRTKADVELIDWAKQVERLGAGEILLTSIDRDGTLDGFDLEMLTAVCEVVNIPVIASGGAGRQEDFAAVFENTNVDAALAASIFHRREVKIADLKGYLESKDILIRK